MNTITNFAKQALAFIKGDTDGVIVAQNERKANSHLKSQIAVLEGKVVEQEEAVNDRKEALAKTKFPSERITDGESYLNSIRRAQENLDTAQEKLDTTNESIEYWKALLVEYNEQVEAAVAEQA